MRLKMLPVDKKHVARAKGESVWLIEGWEGDPNRLVQVWKKIRRGRLTVVTELSGTPHEGKTVVHISKGHNVADRSKFLISL